jgi:hypothetical protein
MQRTVVHFTVLRVTAPKGTFTGSQALWKAIPGKLEDASAASCLRDNGFLAAIGMESDRVTLKNHLDRIESPLSGLDQLTPNESRLVEIDLGPCSPRQTVFHYDRGGRLRGEEFVDGRARLRLAFEIRSTRLDEVWLQLAPEIEEPPGPPRWTITAEGARQVQDERLHTFRDLILGGKIPPGGFLLLGPTPDIYQQPLLGRAFFVDHTSALAEDQSDPRESILVISPVVSTRSDERNGAVSRQP